MAPAPENGIDRRGRARQDARAEVTGAAFKVFAERGFDQVTATEAAAAAGVSRASFFRYFDSKEQAVLVAEEAVGATVSTRRSRPSPSRSRDWPTPTP